MKLDQPQTSFPNHLRDLERRCLRLLTSEDLNRLLVAIPVRHGKTQYMSYLMAWLLIMQPDTQICYVSHTATFSETISSKVMEIVRRWGPQLTGVHLHPSWQGKGYWRLSEPHRGLIKAAGVGGSIAGLGFNLIVADDLVADAEAAANPDQREKLWTWWVSELITRLHPGGKCINTLARRHPDDISGRLEKSNDIAQGKYKWDVVRYPALDDEDGENPRPLWPERYSVEHLIEVRKQAIESGQGYIWNCLYQQDPVGDPSQIAWPPEYFHSIWYDDGMQPNNQQTVLKIMAMDPSIGKRPDKGDYACIVAARFDGVALWVEDIFLDRLPIAKVEDIAVEMCRQYIPDAFLIETNHWQETVANNIISKAEERQVYCPVFPADSKIDKNVRINMTLSHMLMNKRIKIRRDLSRANLLVRQMKEWPTGAHDDGVDALSLAVHLLGQLNVRA